MTRRTHIGSVSGTFVVVSVMLLAAIVLVLFLRSGAEQAPAPPPESAEQIEQRLTRLQERASAALEADRAHTVLPDARAFLEDHPDSPDAMVLVGQLLLSQREFEEAYDLLDRALALGANSAPVHLLAGTIAYEQQQYDAAIKHYQQAVDREPDKTGHRLHLAQAYMGSDRLDDAAAVLGEALQLDSSSAQGYAMLSDLHAAREQWTDAADALRKALSLSEGEAPEQRHVLIQKLAALMRKQFEPRESLLLLQSIRDPREPDPMLLRDLAESWMMLGRPDAAAEEDERAVELEPMNWRYVASASTWRHRAGDDARAREHLQRLREMNPRTPLIQQLQRKLDSAE